MAGEASAGPVSEVLELWIPGWVPDPCLGLNGRRRTFWTVQRKAIQESKEMLWSAAMAYGLNRLPRWDKARMTIEFRYPTNRRRDRDNEMAKAKGLIDGAVDLRIIWDDDSEHLVGLTVTPVYERGVTETRLRVEEVEADG